jgi:hypothetical protein
MAQRRRRIVLNTAFNAAVYVIANVTTNVPLWAWAARFVAVFVLLASCSETDEDFEFTQRLRQEDSLRAVLREDSLKHAARAKRAMDAVPLVHYRRTMIDDKAALDSLRRAYARSNKAAYRAFTTVNRKDLQFFRIGDTVIIPSAIHEDLRVYSVFPHYYGGADSLPKLVVVSNTFQSYACYEHGKLVRFAACNTGEERKPTFPGRYAMNWRDKLRHSSIDSTWELPWTWNIHLYAGSAFHQFEMPGRPVSHSCIRQFMDDAEWLFRWGQQGQIDTAKRKYIPMTGTPVIIVDVFDFSRKHGGAWWDLGSNKETFVRLPAKPMEVEEALIPVSQIPPEVRWSLPNKERYAHAEDTLRKRGVIRATVQLTESVNFNKLRRDKAQAVLLAKKAAEKNAAARAQQLPQDAGDADEATGDALPITTKASAAKTAKTATSVHSTPKATPIAFGEIVRDSKAKAALKAKLKAKTP